LSYLAAPRTVGIYVAISRITLLLRELAETYSLPLFTGLSASAAQGSRAFVSQLQTGLRYAAVIVLPITVGGCLRGREFLSFVFGPGYAAGSEVLGILLAAVFFVVLAGPYRMGLIAHGHQRSIFWITAVGAALSVGLNATLIPRYSMFGAGLSALVSEAFVFVLALVLLSRIVAVSPWRPVLAPAAAAAGMASVLWLLPHRSFAVSAAIGAGTYGLLAVLFRAVRPHELLKALRWRSPSTTPEAPRSLR
jgi:O-antigen/teichoic acid export membrane protein